MLAAIAILFLVLSPLLVPLMAAGFGALRR